MKEIIQGRENFEQKRRKFFADFAMKHFGNFRLHKEFNVLQKQGGWRKVSEHCLAESVAADTLAAELNLSVKERQAMVTAALLHDFYKRRELEAEKQSGAKGMEQEMEHARVILEERGLSQDVIRLIDAVEHTALERIARDPKTSFTEKLMHYLDTVTMESDIVSPGERIDYFERRYHDIGEQGREIFNGKSYWEVEREVCRAIEQEIAQRLGLSKPEDVPGFIREKITERIRKWREA